MKRQNLKVGMVVLLRNDLKGVVTSKVVNETTVYCENGAIYTFTRDDFQYYHYGTSIYDIIKVYLVHQNILESEYNLLWEEKEEQAEYTIKELEELTGINNLKIKK